MIQKTFHITLDTKRGVVESPIVVVKGDTGNVFNIRVQDDGTDLDLTGLVIIVAFRGADGAYTQDTDTGSVTIDGAVVTVPVAKESVSEGTNSCDVQIYDGNSLVTTAAFTFECRAATVGEDSIRNDVSFPFLIELITEMNAACERFPEISFEEIPGGHRILVTNIEGVLTTCDVMDGVSGVYVGSGTMPAGFNVQIDPNGSADEVDYDSLNNLPTLNGNGIVGTLTSSDLGVADASHSHTVSDISDFAHTHGEAEITGLVSDLAGKLDTPASEAEKDTACVLLGARRSKGLTLVEEIEIGADGVTEIYRQSLGLRALYVYMKTPAESYAGSVSAQVLIRPENWSGDSEWIGCTVANAVYTGERQSRFLCSMLEKDLFIATGYSGATNNSCAVSMIENGLIQRIRLTAPGGHSFPVGFTFRLYGESV